MSNTVTFTGITMHLEGTLPGVGDKAPDFSLADGELKARSLGDYSGRVLVLVCVPSLDTPVCDMEVRRFNKEAAGLSDKVAIVAVSRDLPFAQARWCGAAGVKAVETLSDYRDGSFGRAFGVYISELGLLARCVFIVKDGVVQYVQLVPEVTDQPDFDGVLRAVKKLSYEAAYFFGTIKSVLSAGGREDTFFVYEIVTSKCGQAAFLRYA